MSSTRQLLLGIAGHLSGRRKRQIVIWTLGSVITALAELLSLGTVLPFLAVISEPAQIWQWSWVRRLGSLFGWSSPVDLLVPFAVAFSLTAFLAAAVRLINLWSGERLAAAIGSDLGAEAYRRVLYQPYSFHFENTSSRVIGAITGQIGVAVTAVTACLRAFSCALVGCSLLLALFIVDPVVASSLFVLFLGAYSLIGFLSRRALARNGNIVSKSRVKVIASLQEGLGSIREVILEGTQDFYLSRYASSDRSFRSASANNQFLPAFPRFALEALGLIGIACLAVTLVVSSGSGVVVLPVLGTFAIGAQRLLPAMQQAYSAWSSLNGFAPDLLEVLDLLSRPLPPVEFSGGGLSLDEGIQLRGIVFSYGDKQVDVLRGLSLEVAAGERVGLIGSTGSGKSTTVDLLMGLLIPKEGHILVDGLNIHDPSHPESLIAWRSLIAHVPQSVYLADSSVAENIAFGVSRENIDFDLVRSAARQAQISSFIESCPDGYDSFVGERGVRLSGGQRQRLGIARALYKRSKVLVLDEATSALDNDTEQAVMDSINQLDRNLTVVMIAHRLSTVAKCDRVIRLDHGRVVADGPPSEVLAQA